MKRPIERSARASHYVFLAFVVASTAIAAAQPAKPKPIWARNNPLPYGFNVGEPFPTIALPSADTAQPVSLAEFRGKKAIVNVFASW